MPSTREIRRRIRSVKNIAQVTKAMETVAASRMRRAQAQVVGTRPFAEKAWEVLSYIARLPATENALDSLIQPRAVVKRVGVVLITADRGLAAGFNANVIRRSAQFLRTKREQGMEVEVVAVGRKGRDWLMRYDRAIRSEFTGLTDAPTTNDISPITRGVVNDFMSGRFDEVYIIYTEFINTLIQKPQVKQLLPIEPANPPVTMAPEYIFEPDPQTVLNKVLYEFTEVQILQSVYESLASEHSARMVAMRNATEAANDLIGDLTLRYNKARQEGITSELMDIVGGTTALEDA